MTQNSSKSPRWSNWVRPEGIGILEKMGFWDSSWGDDACPSWTHEGLDMIVMVDLPQEFSELQHQKESYTQYAVYHIGEEGQPGDHILSTNDFSDILSYTSKQSCITGPDGQHACDGNGNPCHCQCAECYPNRTVKHCKLCLSIEAGHNGMGLVESYIEDRRNDGLFLITEPSPAGTPFEEVIANCHTPLHREDGMVRLNPDLGIDSHVGYHFEVTMYDFDHLT